MANKKTEKVQISRDCFLRIIREKGYTVERLGEVPEIDRSSKTIQRCLAAGEMQLDLPDCTGRFLDVDSRGVDTNMGMTADGLIMLMGDWIKG